jgi:hypothetical protein
MRKKKFGVLPFWHPGKILGRSRLAPEILSGFIITSEINRNTLFHGGEVVASLGPAYRSQFPDWQNGSGQGRRESVGTEVWSLLP